MHWFAYVMWPIAWLHGIGSGTDRGSAWYVALAVVAAITVAGALIWRLGPDFATLGSRRGPLTKLVPT